MRAADIPVCLTWQIGMSAPHKSVFLELGYAIDGFLEILTRFVSKAVFHEEGIFSAIFIESAQDANSFEFLLTEEELSGQVGFPDLKGDPGPAMAGELADELPHHLGADPMAPP